MCCSRRIQCRRNLRGNRISNLLLYFWRKVRHRPHEVSNNSTRFRGDLRRNLWCSRCLFLRFRRGLGSIFRFGLRLLRSPNDMLRRSKSTHAAKRATANCPGHCALLERNSKLIPCRVTQGRGLPEHSADVLETFFKRIGRSTTSAYRRRRPTTCKHHPRQGAGLLERYWNPSS